MKTLSIGIFLVSILTISLALYTDNKYGGGERIYTLPDTENVLFSHEYHGRYVKLDCAECHSAVFKMTRDNFIRFKQKDESMMSLFEEGLFCGRCHNNSKAFTTTDNCNLCHFE